MHLPALTTAADVFVRSFLVASDQSSFDKAVSCFGKTASLLRASHNVNAYAVCVPNANQSGPILSNDSLLTILIEERYPNETARDGTDSSKYIADCETAAGADFVTQNTIVSKPPITFSRSHSLETAKDPFIVTASFLYQTGKAQPALTGWKQLVDYTEQHENGTYTYSVFKLIDTLTTFEVYESLAYVTNVHLKSPAIAANDAQNGKWRVANETFATKWHLAGGFLYR